MKLTLGFSPCPNDTFIFDAIVNRKIDLEGLGFEPCIADVEELNRKGFNGELQISKLSFHAYLHLREKYNLCDAGSAMGDHCGPLLIAKRMIDDAELKSRFFSVAIPGVYTTANLLLSIAYPQLMEKKVMLFSEIEKSVAEERTDLGVIIHENRFTYKQKGLKKICDLGEYWQSRTGLPIPLGGIFIRCDLPQETQKKFSRVMRNSVVYALENPSESKPFIKTHAQELDDSVINQHIALYVNDLTVSIGAKGKKAVETLLRVVAEAGM